MSLSPLSPLSLSLSPASTAHIAPPRVGLFTMQGRKLQLNAKLESSSSCIISLRAT
jgi:hypothetical protein